VGVCVWVCVCVCECVCVCVCVEKGRVREVFDGFAELDLQEERSTRS